jgi:hypothetical protein
MCDVLLPPGVNPHTVKYIYHIIYFVITLLVAASQTAGAPSRVIPDCEPPNTFHADQSYPQIQIHLLAHAQQ